VLADGELTEPERAVVRAAEAGGLADLRAGDVGRDDPGQAAGWGRGRTVRAELLADLLTGQRRPGGGQARAVRLRGARVSGALDLEAARLECPLLLDRCFLEHPVSLRDARAQAIRLPGCHVPGIIADQLRAEGSVELNEGFTAAGMISLAGARIGGQLDLSSAAVTGSGGLAVDGDGLSVEQNLACAGLAAAGEVRLAGAHIGGRLDLGGARLENPGGCALGADGLSVRLSMFCRDGFTALGEIRLRTAQIAGQLNFTGATLSNPAGRVLSGLGLTVGQDMFCRSPFSAEGEIRITGARIGGSLDFGGAELDNAGGHALSASGVTVAQDLGFGDGFTAHGQVRLPGARIGGRLDLDGTLLAGPGGIAADLSGTVSSVICLLPRTPPDGVIDLTNAQAGSFHDDPESRPAPARLRGFAYGNLQNETASLTSRLAWLKSGGEGYAPGPYDQLAGAYRRVGHAGPARRVAIAKERERQATQSWPGKIWSWLLYATVGYGYRNWLAGAWLGALLVLGSAVFASSYPAHMHRAALVEPAFQPVIYALDVLVPVINFGQQQAWIPQGAALAISWALTAAGWILTTALAAGLANALNRDRP
jgi:hypothetical protein